MKSRFLPGVSLKGAVMLRKNSYGGLIEQWKVKMITTRARRYGFSESDIPDIEQRIVMELLKVDFDSGLAGGAKETTFVIEVIDRQMKKALRDKYRDVRRANYETVPLDEPLTERTFFKMHQGERFELLIDLERAMAGLSAEEREICEGLMRGDTQAEIAREKKRSKAAMSEAVKRLREKLRKWGIDDYI